MTTTPHNSGPRVYVIVLNFNGGSMVVDCIERLFHSLYTPLEIVCVDNGSVDGSCEAVHLRFPRVHIIRNGANLGFAQGVNIGIRFALERGADYVLLLNSDAFLDSGSISKMITEAECRPASGLYNPVIIGPDRSSIWWAGGIIDWYRMRTTHINLVPVASAAWDSEYATGCVMLVRKEVFRQIGLFDDQYFLYYEDADFSLRAINAGFHPTVLGNVTAIHLEKSNADPLSKMYWLVVSGIRFFSRHTTLIRKPWFYTHLALRYMKNFFMNSFSPTPITRELSRAYNDYFTQKATSGVVVRHR